VISKVNDYNTANDLVRQARYSEATEKFQSVLPTFVQTFGPDHRNVGVVLNSLSVAYLDQGRYVEAEQYARQALAVFDSHGLENPDSCMALQNLANIMNYQRRYAEAETLIKRAIAILENTTPVNYLRLGQSYSILGIVYERHPDMPKPNRISDRRWRLIDGLMLRMPTTAWRFHTT
jgi:tetratricopeptide (TPR) repeat protein